MDRIEIIKAKIEQIENLLNLIKRELDNLQKNENNNSKKLCIEKSLPSDEKLQSEYEKLYEKFTEANIKYIEDFVKDKSKAYLKAFCKANNLPVDTTKLSKEAIVNQIIQWLSQRKLISKNVIYK